MNVYRRAVIAMVVLAAAVVVGFVALDDSAPDIEKGRVPQTGSAPGIADASGIDATSDGDNQKEQYFLMLDGDVLSAYRIYGEEKELIRSSNLKPLLMSEKELHSLCDGIYADSFEDLCLYFESYAS